MSELTYNECKSLIEEKHNLENKMAKIGHDIWLKKNEKIKAGRQLALVETQLRLSFNRPRLVFKEDKDADSKEM